MSRFPTKDSSTLAVECPWYRWAEMGFESLHQPSLITLWLPGVRALHYTDRTVGDSSLPHSGESADSLEGLLGQQPGGKRDCKLLKWFLLIRKTQMSSRTSSEATPTGASVVECACYSCSYSGHLNSSLGLYWREWEWRPNSCWVRSVIT